MKKFNLLLFFAVLFSAVGFAQTTSYSVYANQDSIQGACTEGLYVYIEIGSGGETAGQLTVDWGDGTTDITTYTVPAGQSATNLAPSHGYAVAGTYTINISIYSGTAGANVDAGQSLTVTAADPANCGYIYITTAQIAPWVGYSDVPMDFTGADGITTTIIPSSLNPNMVYVYSGLNLANAPYTVSINDAWLALNNLTQTSADFTITGFQPSGIADPADYQMTVECAATTADPDFGVMYSYAWGFVAPLQSGSVYLNLCNFSCNNTADASVSLDFPAGFIPNTTGLTNAVVTGNTLTFDVPALADCAQLEIPFWFPGTTPAGTQVSFTVTVSHPNDANAANNTATICTYVLNSYDPNAKEVNQPTQINPNVQEELTYVIHFQNDGNFQAMDVVVTDEIDMNLDLSTFQVVGAKHVVATSVNPGTRMVTFSFNDINLAPSTQDLDASQGYVVYKIKENAGLPVNSTIENTANIYFDFNPAIVTNTTYNINQTLGLNEQVTEAISMYPNPAAATIRFNGAAVEAASIFDMAGKQVLSASEVNNNELSVAALSNGIYQVVIHTAKGTQTQKLVIKK